MTSGNPITDRQRRTILPTLERVMLLIICPLKLGLAVTQQQSSTSKELCLVVVSVTGNCEHKYPPQHQELESLTLDRCAMDDRNENVICIMTSHLPKLKHLEILYPYKPVRSIHTYHGFEIATFNQMEIDEGEVLTHLLKLKINKCNLHGSLWKPPVPTRMKYIQHLDISYCVEIPYQILSHFSHLKELNLSG